MIFMGKDSYSAVWKGRGLLLAFLFVMISAFALFACKKKQEPFNSMELISGAHRGDDLLVRMFLQKGANVNSRDDNGCTPIVIAASGGYLSTVNLLMGNGADINTSCNNGVNPLSAAASHGHTEIVRLLLARSADVNRRGEFDATPLTYAIGNGHTEIVRLLLEKGAEINFHLKYGDTPLILAVQRENESIVRMLLDKGADARERADGVSPLEVAIDKGNTVIAQLLIEKGADVSLRAGNGFTPLQQARSKNLDRIVALLQAAGAREQEDSFRAAAAELREKQEKARREIEKKGLEFMVIDSNVQYFVKPESIRKMNDATYRAVIWEYSDTDEIDEISMELNCIEYTYRHLSNVLRDMSGKVLQVTPVESYTLADGGHIKEGSFMHRILLRVCGMREAQ